MTSPLRIGFAALWLAANTLLSSTLLGGCASTTSDDVMDDDTPIESQNQANEEESDEADWEDANR